MCERVVQVLSVRQRCLSLFTAAPHLWWASQLSECHYSSVPILTFPLQSLRTLCTDGKLPSRNAKTLGKTREGWKRGRERLSLHISQLSWQDFDWASLVISFLQVSWCFLQTVIAALLSFSLPLSHKPFYLLSEPHLSNSLSFLQLAPIFPYLLLCLLLALFRMAFQYDLRSSMLLKD